MTRSSAPFSTPPPKCGGLESETERLVEAQVRRNILLRDFGDYKYFNYGVALGAKYDIEMGEGVRMVADR